MNKKLVLLTAFAALMALQMPAAEAVNLGRIGNIGNIGRSHSSSSTATGTILDKTIEQAVSKMTDKTIVFESLPQTAAEVAVSTDAQRVAALTVAALARYETSPSDCYAMLNALLGPRPLNGADQQFIQDRFRGKEYLMRSYFKGATPNNDYTPDRPYKVEVKTNNYTFQEKGYARFLIACGGADSPRPMTLRKKESTGEWFLWDYKGLLSGIRIPKSADPWA